MLRVRELSESLVPTVDSYLRRDLIPNLYPLYDLHFERDSMAKFHIAIEDGDVVGLLLIYESHPHNIAWLLCDVKGSESLLGLIRFDKGTFLATQELADMIRERFSITAEYEMDVMELQIPKAKVAIKHDVRRLSANDFKAWAASVEFAKEDVGLSNENLAEAKQYLQKSVAFGIYDGEKLVSRGASYVRLPEAWNVGAIYTNPVYRGRGLATSITSRIVAESRPHTSRMMLFVRNDNTAAKRIYEKIGFETVSHRTYLDMGTGIVK